MLDGKSVYIAVGMLGATVMPHVVYLHSALVQPRITVQRDDYDARGKFSSGCAIFATKPFDVFVAMNSAWLVNSAMVVVAAAVFGGSALANPIEDAHRTLGPLLGPASAIIFAIALLCSGLSSSTVGTMAGQVIIEGFLHIRFSIFLRRLLTIIPAVVVIAVGLDPLRDPHPLAGGAELRAALRAGPAAAAHRQPRGHEEVREQPRTHWLGWLTISIIIALNVFLLWQAI